MEHKKTETEPKTIGQAIDEQVEEIIQMAQRERKHWGKDKSNKEMAGLLLYDEHMAIFKAEEIIKKVREIIADWED